MRFSIQGFEISYNYQIQMYQLIWEPNFSLGRIIRLYDVVFGLERIDRLTNCTIIVIIFFSNLEKIVLKDDKLTEN